jgi:uncharacterized membrane protein
MKEKNKTFQIRFNTSSISSEDKWRLIEDDNEILVSNVIVNGHTYTTKDWIKDIDDYKWHISCEGSCKIKNNIAYINADKEKSPLIRHILKTVSYRILGTLTTVIVAYWLGASVEVSSMIGIGEILLKPIIYFMHERMWYKWIRIGLNK